MLLPLIVWSRHSCPLAFDFGYDFDFEFEFDREEHGFSRAIITPKTNPALASEGNCLMVRGAVELAIKARMGPARESDKKIALQMEVNLGERFKEGAGG